MKISPVGTKLLIIPIAKEDETLDSGIIMAASTNAELNTGKVVAVSSQISDLYKEGDVILYPSKKGVGIVLDGKPHLWLDAEPSLGEIWGLVI